MTAEQSKRRCPASLLEETHAADRLNYRDRLQTLFKDSQTYRQMANIFLQVASLSGLNGNSVQELKQNLTTFQIFNQLINIKGESFEGRIEQPSVNPSLNTGQASLESLVSLLNISVEKEKDFQEKKQYLGSVIRNLIKQVPKTACDIENIEFNQASRFRAQFPRKNKNQRIDATQPITINLLKKQIENQTVPKQHDFLLESKLLKTSFGHGAMDQQVGYSPIFNVIYDKSGRLIISADEDGLIKIWSSQTGLLLWSFRGHVSFIEQLHITQSNRYLVSCANDGIRVWCLQTKACLVNLFFQKTVLTLTSYRSEETNEQVICFADSENFYKMTQSQFVRGQGKLLSEGTLRSYPLPKSRRENNLVCQIEISCNNHVVIGFQSGQIIIFDRSLLKLDKIDNIPYTHSWQHTDKCVQIKWNDKGTLLASCSLDGSCRIWQFSQAMLTQRTIKCVKKLQMHRNEKKRYKQKDIICNTVNWTCNYNYIIIAFSECNKDIDNGVNNVGEGDIVIFDANKMEVLHEAKSKFPYQLESISVLEPHPIYQNIALYCGSTGRVVIFDIFQCCILTVMNSRGFHVEHPNFDLEPVDGKWHPNGNTFVLSSQFGNVSIYGYGSKDFYHICPTEQFFSSDNELFTLDDDRIPMLVDAPIDINAPDRGNITNINKNPYNFKYRNDLTALKQRNTPYTYQPNNSYDIPVSFMSQMIQQRNQNQNHEEALRVASLSISKVELMEQYRISQERLDEALKRKIEEFNSGSYKRLEYRETDLMNIVQQSQKKPKKQKFKKLRRNVSDDQEMSSFSQAFDQQSSESEVLPRKRTRRQFKEQPTQKKIRKTPAQEIKQLEQEYEMLHRNERRKRLHQLYDDQDVYGASESKKQSNSDSPKCKRCQTQRINKTCQSCNNGYCENCKIYRGKGQNSFKCFQCYVMQNQLNEQRTVYKSVYEQDTRNKHYVPQIGDEVYFFFQGYEQLIQKFHQSFPNKLYQIHQKFQFYLFDEEKELRNIPLCVIMRIDYMFPIKSRDRMSQQGEQRTRHNLLVLLKLQSLQTNVEFSVVYIYDQVNFLVRKEVLNKIDKEDVIQRLKINETVISKGRDFIIIKKSPLQYLFPLSSWKYLVVHNSGQRLRRHSSANRRISPWQIDRYCQLPYQHLDESISRKILTNIQQLHSAKRQIFEYLYYDVDTKLYKDYNYFVEVGISVQKIQKRLKNKYYRHKQSLIFDINLIVRNSQTFNGPQHIVTQHTLLMKEELMKIVQSNGNVVYSDIKKENKKVSKKNEQIEEVQSQSYVQESKSLEFSGEYEQSSMSNNRIVTRSRRAPRENKTVRTSQQNHNRRVTRSTRL